LSALFRNKDPAAENMARNDAGLYVAKGYACKRRVATMQWG